MNRKLGQLIKAALFALPLALPGVALAQSTSDTVNPGVQNNNNLDKSNNNLGNSNPTGPSGMSSGSSTGTFDQTEKQNAGSPDNSTGVTPQGTGNSDVDRNPPAGSLGTSGSTSSSDRNLGGDINKSDNGAMGSDTSSSTTTRQKKTKKTAKGSTKSDLDNGNSNDMNR